MNWQLFLSIYVLIFVAELPDKTAFATLLLATRSRPLSVFLGAATAFLIQTMVAALFGSLISLLPKFWVHIAASILFLAFAIHMWRDRNVEEKENSPPTLNGAVGFWWSAWKSFVVIFIAEWGDLTQIATASLIAKYHEYKVTVFVAALLALWSVTVVAIVLGNRAKDFIKPSLMKQIAAILFLIIGTYFFVSALKS